MLTVAYLANQFPCAVEHYVGDEIEELQRGGVRVIAGSVRKTENPPEIVLRSVGLFVLIEGAWLCVREWRRLSDIFLRVLCRGQEGPWSRTKALMHTWLGGCYAVLLCGRAVDHIHVHHGYFGSWIAMVAARLLGVSYSMTLHGSDLLLHGAYLDVKLANCNFCLTVSDYNQRYILEHFPRTDAERVLVARLGVDVSDRPAVTSTSRGDMLNVLSVGRLHKVKDHAFLVRACALLREQGVPVQCLIAGEGPERGRLGSLIHKLDLNHRVFLLGHVPRGQVNSLYDRADLVVLPSRRAGIPLVIMEAMARGKIVLAPCITGIPELVASGKTGFLYQPGSLADFVAHLQFIYSSTHSAADTRPAADSDLSAAHQLDWIRHAAQVQVRLNFNRKKNLHAFGDLFIHLVQSIESIHHEDIVLQQIQLPVQRNGSIPVRSDGVDAVAGPRGSAVLDV